MRLSILALGLYIHPTTEVAAAVRVSKLSGCGSRVQLCQNLNRSLSPGDLVTQAQCETNGCCYSHRAYINIGYGGRHGQTSVGDCFHISTLQLEETSNTVPRQPVTTPSQMHTTSPGTVPPPSTLTTYTSIPQALTKSPEPTPPVTAKSVAYRTPATEPTDHNDSGLIPPDVSLFNDSPAASYNTTTEKPTTLPPIEALLSRLDLQADGEAQRVLLEKSPRGINLFNKQNGLKETGAILDLLQQLNQELHDTIVGMGNEVDSLVGTPTLTEKDKKKLENKVKRKMLKEIRGKNDDFRREPERPRFVFPAHRPMLTDICPINANMNSCCSTYSPCCRFELANRDSFEKRMFGGGTADQPQARSIGSMGIGQQVMPPPAIRLKSINFGHTFNFHSGRRLQSRIVGGQNAHENDLRRHMAYLKYVVEPTPFCGGTLIHPRWVVTAAHCLLEFCGRTQHGPIRDIVVMLGKVTKWALKTDPHASTHGVQRVVCHKNCRPDRSAPRINDVALMQLIRAAPINSAIEPAMLPTTLEPVMSLDCITLGWGSTQENGKGDEEYLQQATMKLWSNRQCNQAEWRDCSIRACMLCAGEQNSRPCKGDSGGPLLCPVDKEKSHYVLHGVYSYGRCARVKRKPAVYTRVAFYLDFIEDTINKYESMHGY